MINYTYKELPVRKYYRKNLTTGKIEIVTVTNKNNLSIDKHISLLNLNDSNYFYFIKKD